MRLGGTQLTLYPVHKNKPAHTKQTGWVEVTETKQNSSDSGALKIWVKSDNFLKFYYILMNFK